MNRRYGSLLDWRRIHNTQSHKYRVMNAEKDATVSPLSITELSTTIGSGEFNLDDTISIDATPFCQNWMSSNYRTSKCEQVNDLKSLINARNRNYNELRSHQGTSKEKHLTDEGRQDSCKYQLGYRRRRARHGMLMKDLSQSFDSHLINHLNENKEYLSGPPSSNKRSKSKQKNAGFPGWHLRCKAPPKHFGG